MKERSTPFRLVALVVAFSICIPSISWADPDRAAEYYKQATDAYQSGDLQTAADLLQRAYAEEPDLVYQYNRVLALEALTDYAAAQKVLDIYEEQMLRDDGKRFADVPEIKARLAKARTEESEQLAADKAAKEEEERKKEEQRLADLAKKKPKESSTNWGAISLISIGGASLIAGTLFGSGVFVSDLAEAKCISGELGDGMTFDDAIFECDTEEIFFEDEYQAVLDSQSTQQILAISFWSAGALALGGGIIWLLTGESDSEVSIAPMLIPGGAGAAAGLRF